MDTTIKCCNCDREMGLAEFLTYPEAYLMKLIEPVLVPYFIGLMAQKFQRQPKMYQPVKQEVLLTIVWLDLLRIFQ